MRMALMSNVRYATDWAPIGFFFIQLLVPIMGGSSVHVALMPGPISISRALWAAANVGQCQHEVDAGGLKSA